MTNEPQSRLRSSRVKIALGLCIIAVALTAAWTAFGARVTEVDINSGRFRHRTEFHGITLTEEIVEWPFSDAVARHGLATSPPDWHTAWCRPVGLARLIAWPNATGLYGHAFADLRSAFEHTDMLPRLQEKESIATLLDMLKSRDSQGIHAFVSSLLDEQSVSPPSAPNRQ